MTSEKHWTENSVDDFVFQLTFDFVAQLEGIIGRNKLKQKDLAQMLGVSAGRVSQMLRNPAPLTLRSMAGLTRHLGSKLSVLVYDDNDVDKQRGPIDPEVFRDCWELMGKPHDFGELANRLEQRTAKICESCGYGNKAALPPANWDAAQNHDDGENLILFPAA